MRVSEQQRYNTTINRVEKAKQNNSKMLEVMSTNKTLNHISDDPVGAARVIRGRERIESYRQYQKNIDFAVGYIEKAESSIRSIHDFLVRAKKLAVGMSNATYDAKGRKLVSEEVKEVMNAVVQLGNTTYGNRYVFGGFRTQTPPLARDGGYLGDDGAFYMQIDENSFRQINVQARSLFEASEDERKLRHFDMIESLRVLYDGLKDNNVESIRLAMDELEFQLQKAASYEASLGTIHNAINDARERLELGEELTQKNLSKVEDADMYKSVSQFKKTETILQSTLMASNKLLQPSLLNFMQ